MQRASPALTPDQSSQQSLLGQQQGEVQTAPAAPASPKLVKVDLAAQKLTHSDVYLK